MFAYAKKLFSVCQNGFSRLYPCQFAGKTSHGAIGVGAIGVTSKFLTIES